MTINAHNVTELRPAVRVRLAVGAVAFAAAQVQTYASTMNGPHSNQTCPIRTSNSAVAMFTSGAIDKRRTRDKWRRSANRQRKCEAKRKARIGSNDVVMEYVNLQELPAAAKSRRLAEMNAGPKVRMDDGLCW